MSLFSHSVMGFIQWPRLALLLLAPIGGVMAGNGNDVFELSLEELMQVKVSGATLTEEGLQRVPSAVTVFTREQIRRLGVDNIEELLNLVPGFQRYRQGGDGLIYTFSARGRRINSGVGEILTLVDGLPITSPRVGNNANTLAGVAAENVERVEFIRGPGSAIYGSNAMMGVINIVTTRFRHEAKLLTGSFNRKAGELLWAGTWDEVSLDLHTRVDHDDGDRFIVHDTFSPALITTSDARSLADLYLKFKWRDTAFHFRRGTREVDQFYVFDLLSNDINQTQSSRNQYALTQAFEWGPMHSQIMLSATDDHQEQSAQLLPAGALAAISDPASSEPLLARAVFESSKIQLTWHNDWALDDGSVQWGADLRRIKTTKAIAYNNFDLHDLANGLFPVRYYDEMLPTTALEKLSERDNIALYAQYLRPITDSTDLTLGVRWDDYQEIGDHVSPRGGLIHQINPVHTVKLLYGEAFRAPSNGELDLINNPVILGNPDLKPETVATWDLIWMANWQQLAISAGYFRNHFEDSIITVPLGSVIQYQNAEQGPSRGVELELNYQLNEEWLLRATAMHLFTKPDNAFREADDMFSLSLSWQHDVWRAGVTAVHHGERERAINASNSTRTELPAYWVFDGKLTYQVNPDFDVFVQGRNLTDKTYETPPQSYTLTQGTINRGRELALGIHWTF